MLLDKNYRKPLTGNVHMALLVTLLYSDLMDLVVKVLHLLIWVAGSPLWRVSTSGRLRVVILDSIPTTVVVTVHWRLVASLFCFAHSVPCLLFQALLELAMVLLHVGGALRPPVAV